MRFLFPYLRRLEFKYVAIANGALLFAAQIMHFMLKDEVMTPRAVAMVRILEANNTSMAWYLVAGVGFFLFYRYKEKQSGNTGKYMGSFWIPLTVWVIGLTITTAMTIKSLIFVTG